MPIDHALAADDAPNDGGYADPAALIRLLRGPALRCRTGILLLPLADLGREPDLAARLGIGCVDYARALANALPPGAVFVPLSAETEESRLDALASDETGEAGGGTDCLLVYNLDLALAKLDPAERARLWSNLQSRFPNRRRALLLALPDPATHLLPATSDLAAWHETHRVARLSDP